MMTGSRLEIEGLGLRVQGYAKVFFNVHFSWILRSCLIFKAPYAPDCGWDAIWARVSPWGLGFGY